MSEVKKNYKIGIDARFYGPVGKGLGRYTQELVDRIISLDKDNKYVIFLSPANFDQFETNNPLVKKVLVKARWYSFKEQIFFPWQVFKERLDLMHFTHFNVPVLIFTKFIVTIHDLILVRFPTKKGSQLKSWLYRLKYLAYRLVIFLAVLRAKKIMAVSNFTKQDLLQEFRVKAEKINVTYEGVSNLQAKTEEKELDDKEVLNRYNVREEDKFLLYVGNAYPHKNLEGLLKIFKQLSEKNDLKLILVGQVDYFYERIKVLAQDLELFQAESADKVIFTGYVPDKDLDVLFSKAYAYIFPSFYEGFGLPPLEAMSKGCPVISSDKGSLPEILGSAAYYFNPKKTDEAVLKIQYFLENEDLRQKLIAKGRDRVKLYNWQTCANKTLEIYKQYL
ncbi:MAG: glycosyltransferase family 4 protein [Candidatus Pacebacteria bacterium]|nr:glycosyltransferase family 4 protein [Candidatus Paceibacterota bacterium]